MANWDSYTEKTTPSDNDTLMIKDTSASANKRTPFSGVWNWIVNKLTSAVISNLETTNKSIIPAINELNSNSYLLQGGISIPESSDLNDYTTVRNYYCNNNAIAASLQNAPFSAAFTLKVEQATGSSEYPCQTARNHQTGIKAWRKYNPYSETWTNWAYFSDDKTLFAGTAINSGDDLNDYTTPGIYKSTSSVITTTLINMPEIFTSGFSMLVLPINVTSAVSIQVIFKGGPGGNIYTRSAISTGWQSWYKFKGTAL